MPTTPDRLPDVTVWPKEVLELSGELEELDAGLDDLFGRVPLDRVTGRPLAVWDRLRDLGTRLERLERAHDSGLAEVVGQADAVRSDLEPRIAGLLDGLKAIANFVPALPNASTDALIALARGTLELDRSLFGN